MLILSFYDIFRKIISVLLGNSNLGWFRSVIIKMINIDGGRGGNGKLER